MANQNYEVWSGKLRNFAKHFLDLYVLLPAYLLLALKSQKHILSLHLNVAEEMQYSYLF